jgi:hypothetical protein
LNKYFLLLFAFTSLFNTLIFYASTETTINLTRPINSPRVIQHARFIDDDKIVIHYDGENDTAVVYQYNSSRNQYTEQAYRAINDHLKIRLIGSESPIISKLEFNTIKQTAQAWINQNS